tara:strand:+ start:444 stop:602 length:159 start_codon:yes stop_codon:yes gene_type:complete
MSLSRYCIVLSPKKPWKDLKPLFPNSSWALKKDDLKYLENIMVRIIELPHFK